MNNTGSEMVLNEVESRLGGLADKGFKFPANYIPENALQSAWLILQDTFDKDKKQALEVCTHESIQNSMFDMLVQGLNPMKKQCYFIVRGKKLSLQRSYFGTQAVCNRLPEVDDILPAEIVYENDEFEFSKLNGVTTITKHTQKLENIDKTKIKAAYQVIVKKGVAHACIMTIEQILQAWNQSDRQVFDDKGKLKTGKYQTHANFTEEMAKRTVINRACKSIVNTSDDSDILIDAINRTTQNEFEPDERIVDVEPTIINPLQEKIDAMIAGFDALGVSQEQVVEFAGCKLESITEAEIQSLRAWYVELKSKPNPKPADPPPETEKKQVAEEIDCDEMPTGFIDAVCNLPVVMRDIGGKIKLFANCDGDLTPIAVAGEFDSPISAMEWLNENDGFEAAI